MSSHATFIERALNGEILHPVQAIDDEIGAWHSSDTKLPLAEWLGMTADEYALYVERSSCLPAILHARKYNRDLRTFLAETENTTAIAARGVSAEEAGELLDWLRKTGRLGS